MRIMRRKFYALECSVRLAADGKIDAGTTVRSSRSGLSGVSQWVCREDEVVPCFRDDLIPTPLPKGRFGIFSGHGSMCSNLIVVEEIDDDQRWAFRAIPDQPTEEVRPPWWTDLASVEVPCQHSQALAWAAWRDATADLWGNRPQRHGVAIDPAAVLEKLSVEPVVVPFFQLRDAAAMPPHRFSDGLLFLRDGRFLTIPDEKWDETCSRGLSRSETSVEDLIAEAIRFGLDEVPSEPTRGEA